MKIFWSWQSDTPGNIGRHFVRAALLEAIAELKGAEDIDEPTTAENRESMHLDQDRQGVRGSPDLANLIFSKILKAAVFVADVTPVATIPAQNERPEKRNMNPNVAIELGFALHALTDDRLLMVLNEHYGDRKYLPFDLAHKGGPITYSLAPNPKPEESAAERHRLRRKLVEALRGFLDQPADEEARSTFLSIPTSTSNAVWFDRDEPLVPESGGDEAYSFDDKKRIYLRLAPRAGLPAPIPTATLWALARQNPFGILYRQQSGLIAVNRWGAVVYEPYFKRGRLRAATQFFPNGGDVVCHGLVLCR